MNNVERYDIEMYELMCDCPEIQKYFDKKKMGNMVSVVWNESGSTDGFKEHRLQECPTYGLKWFDNQWFEYNGRVNNGGRGAPVLGSMTKYHDFVKVVWLPDQDQLQKLFLLPKDYVHRDLMEMLEQFYEWLDSIDNRGKGSMRQLWIAYVMLKLHNKIWDGGKWILNS